ncbi:iron-containing alcohol dehydrogenase [Rhodovulum sp. 12E13]|uniref:iron-containing alcohol dehydrogenase n=1 Tax=Rhodovulum sp. 12E13 TaxID=2203891 RepID=UPI000E12AEC5|nr:iron-containing alcohol dehydrogenase [Rhodovulum sp. 12E13]RDC71484.1 iron-containing alcohol dehydrogenase [Rhodovulum sp. 12E13]
MPPFSLRLPARVRFGRGALQAALPEIAAFGPRLLLVHGQSAARSAPLRAALEEAGCTVAGLSCPGEPTLKALEQALAEGRAAAPDAVVAMGGGAALDLGKAVAALLPSGSDPLDHLEVVGAGRPLAAAPLPCIAIPTTAGTGSEATKNAVIGVPEHARKVSLRDDRMVPDLAVIDPGLTDGTPKPQTLASGLDAVVQVIEPYLSARATPFTDALARPAIEHGLSALVTLMDKGEDAGARDRLAYTAHVSGIALANAGLGVVHGLAGPLGGETGAPHGAICARLLPSALRALDGKLPASGEGRARLVEVCDLIERSVPGGRASMEGWLDAHGLPAMPSLSGTVRDRVAEAACASSSMKASPVPFDRAELAHLLAAACP